MRSRLPLPVLYVLALTLASGCRPQVAQAASPATAPPASGGSAGTAPSVPAPFATPPVLAGTPDVATLVSKVKPSVVNITTVHEIKAPEMDGSPFGFDPFGMFPQFGGRRGGGDRTYRQNALGSGFIVDTAGHVVTNAHVVEDADEVRVRLADDREFDAKVKGRDAKLDVAVLELIGPHDLPAAALGSSEALRVGEYVVAIGNPFGLGHTVTMGIVSAKSRTIGASQYDDFIQTDASINPGNSGGPLFNLRGQVVGINTAINPAGKGIGFAIPIDELKNVLPQLLATGHVARGRLGLTFQRIDPPLAKALGFDRPKGALVADVEPGGPADRAGIRTGDLIVRIDDTEIVHAEELPRLVARHRPGSHLKIELVRDKVTRTVETTLAELRDTDEQAREGSGSPSSPGPSDLGVGLADVPGQGVVVEKVLRGSPAEGALAPGDVILEVNRTRVAQAAESSRLLRSTPAGQAVLLKVRRGGRTLFVALERR